MRAPLAAAILIAAAAVAPAYANGRAGSSPAVAMGGGWSGGATPWVAEAERWIGSGKFTSLPGAWCADAVSYWLRVAGKPPLPSRMAASALAYGHSDPYPRRGDIAVMPGHVGLVQGVEANGSIDLVSGNWGHRVAHAVLPRYAFLAFRTP